MPNTKRWLAAGLYAGLAWLSLSLATSAAQPDSAHHTFWSVKGQHNTVYLLGSVHMLQPDASDLPPAALRAYTNAKALVMELDLNHVSADDMLGSGLALATLPDGQSLQGVLGPAAYATLKQHAKPLGLDLEILSHFQPWFAAVTVEQLELARLGFDSNYGVDMQLARRAQTDHKQIIALETMAQQLELFARLSLDQQRQFLLYTLKDADQTPQAVAELVSAWRTGDTLLLERLLREDATEFPALLQRLTTDRNRRWLPTISGLLSENQDYLVIVGALHLVGRDGLVDLLKRAGYEVVQH